MSRKMWRTMEPYHGMIYFVPEAGDAFAAAGLADGAAGYFASRSAPMGAVGADTVIATFFNFHPSLVRRYVPACWSSAPPSRMLDARLAAADGALRRLIGDAVDSAEMAEAAGLARRACSASGMSPSGRPLYAGHATVEWPAEPHLVLWHAISCLREYRGDGHIAGLVTEGIDGCQALVTHAASGEAPKGVLLSTRAWPEAEWAEAVAQLQARGIVDGEGSFTDAGRAQRQRIEDLTDELALAPWAFLGQAACDRLRELVRPWSKAIVAGAGLGR
jgi:hypothetical protein